MAFDFNADEIFEMAEQMERNGAKFYSEAAQNIPAGKNRDLLLRLAEMEVEHEKTFVEMRNSLTDKDRQNSVFDPEGETVQYLKALVDTRVFFKKEIDATSMRDILKEALLAEKDAIVFYLGMKDLVPEARGKSHLEHIIKEEMEHIKLIGRELSAAAS